MNAQADASSLNHFELFVLPHKGRGRLLITHVQAIDLTEVSHWAYLPRLLYSILPFRARCQVCILALARRSSEMNVRPLWVFVRRVPRCLSRWIAST